MNYVTYDERGNITAASTIPFEGSAEIDFEVVEGGVFGLFKAGTEPQGTTGEETLMLRLRAARDTRLGATDKYLLPDYPISAEKLAEVMAYRTALRDLPAQPGAPWDGGDELTPWPEQPMV